MKTLVLIPVLACSIAWPVLADLHCQPPNPAIDGYVSDRTYGPMFAEPFFVGCPGLGGAGGEFLPDAVITGVRWYGYYENGGFAPSVGDTVDFSVAFLGASWDDDPVDSIVNELVAASVSTVVEHDGRSIYEFVADPFPAVSIHDVWSTYLNQLMFLAIAECDPDSDDPWLWSLCRSPDESWERLYVTTDLGSWSPFYQWSVDHRGDFAFTLTGIVPVPGAALLGAIGLACSGWRLRRRAA